jgi:uncharacterized membrane protein
MELEKQTTRLEAFSDGVMAIIITITVLSLRMPQGANVGALRPVLPAFFIYILSFQTVGTYWNNHHQIMQTTKEVSTGIMWANLHLLFWLSLIPFVTQWLGENFGTPWPTAAYGGVLLLASIAYILLERTIVWHQGPDSVLARALGRDYKGIISLGCYMLAMLLAFINHWLSYGLYVAVAVLWFIPDRRISKSINATPKKPN